MYAPRFLVCMLHRLKLWNMIESMYGHCDTVYCGGLFGYCWAPSFDVSMIRNFQTGL
jgi:hypothetical protein